MINPAMAQPGKKNSLNMRLASDLSSQMRRHPFKKQAETGFQPPAPYRKAGFSDTWGFIEEPDKETDDLKFRQKRLNKRIPS